MFSMFVPYMLPLALAFPEEYGAYYSPNYRMLEIKIDHHSRDKTYTSGSAISGHVSIRFLYDTPFDDVEIEFTGIAATRLELQLSPYRTRLFMKLPMPISDWQLPGDNVFRARTTYTIPFHFVVPHHLTIGVCNHGCVVEPVREQHLRLPPSMSSLDASHDEAFDVTKIEYAVKATIWRSATAVDHAPRHQVVEAQHVVRVLPALPEDAPLAVNPADERYKMSGGRKVRKSLFSRKTGHVTVTTSQPGPVMLSADGQRASTSSVSLNLEYVPHASDTPPPKIGSAAGKLVSTTFFSASPINHLPNLGSRVPSALGHGATSPILSYSKTHSVFSRPVDASPWTRHDVPTLRCDSGYSSGAATTVAGEEGDAPPPFDSHHLDAPGGSIKNHGKGKGKGKEPSTWASPCRYSTTVAVPFTIPTRNRKSFVPSFHSCLMSRTYTLRLSLSVGPGCSSVRLSVPVQVGVETVHDAYEYGVLPSFETAVGGDQNSQEDRAEMISQRRQRYIADSSLFGNYLAV